MVKKVKLYCNQRKKRCKQLTGHETITGR
uniref:Uncharacterized protein n=1 Tax=Arundo donax TaxID=35708 RepID=A0A0A9C4N2_ARUDO